MERETKANDRKQSFNLEPDVQRRLARWSAANPMVIKSRMFNEALRRYLDRRSTRRLAA
jgi:hypothetical protein